MAFWENIAGCWMFLDKIRVSCWILKHTAQICSRERKALRASSCSEAAVAFLPWLWINEALPPKTKAKGGITAGIPRSWSAKHAKCWEKEFGFPSSFQVAILGTHKADTGILFRYFSKMVYKLYFSDLLWCWQTMSHDYIHIQWCPGWHPQGIAEAIESESESWIYNILSKQNLLRSVRLQRSMDDTARIWICGSMLFLICQKFC